MSLDIVCGALVSLTIGNTVICVKENDTVSGSLTTLANKREIKRTFQVSAGCVIGSNPIHQYFTASQCLQTLDKARKTLIEILYIISGDKKAI